MNFFETIKKTELKQGQIALSWLGQAGFLIRNSKNEQMAIDIYLSDLSERLDGNKRLTQSIVDAEDLEVDIILASHHHTDHLDLDSLSVMLQKDSKLYCCNKSYELCKTAKLPMEKVVSVQVGDVVCDKGFLIEAVFADHGDTAPDALGFMIETEGIKIYFTGDTSYQFEKMSYAVNKKCDILIAPINGEYGNMNERDAAMLAGQIKANLTIPCHFWTFARHQGSPYDFQLAMMALAPECKEYTMAQGETIYYPNEYNDGGSI